MYMSEYTDSTTNYMFLFYLLSYTWMLTKLGIVVGPKEEISGHKVKDKRKSIIVCPVCTNTFCCIVTKCCRVIVPWEWFFRAQTVGLYTNVLCSISKTLPWSYVPLGTDLLQEITGRWSQLNIASKARVNLLVLK